MTAQPYAMTCSRLVGGLKDMIEGEDAECPHEEPDRRNGERLAHRVRLPALPVLWG